MAPAARGDLPGAAQLGKVWTFDRRMIARWVRNGMPGNRPVKPTAFEKLRAQAGPLISARRSYVYFIASGTKAIKIGWAGSVQKRLKLLQTGNPETLTLIATCEGDVTLEQLIHKKFARYRLRGEWFRYSKRIIAFVQEAATQ
jgi:hypothetical protein